MGRFFQGLSNEYRDYKPEGYSGSHDAGVGSMAAEFEAFEPNPRYTSTAIGDTTAAYPLIESKDKSKLPPIDPILQRLIQSKWTRAEPQEMKKPGDDKQKVYSPTPSRGNFVIGQRGGTVTPQRDTYVPHIQSAGANSIDDWKDMANIKRVNAITFRGDSRGPQALLVGNGRTGGFNPPDTRTDSGYIFGPVFDVFQSYMKTRFNVDIDMGTYVSAIAGSAPTPAAKHVLADYLMWRAIMGSEAMHAGRMIANEFLKAYISTSRSLKTARYFAHLYKGTRMEAWFYITRVRGGFYYPARVQGEDTKFTTIEQEVAQLGSITPENIVGFRKSLLMEGNWAGNGPIYVRREFRKSDPVAFTKAFNMLSGWDPT